MKKILCFLVLSFLFGCIASSGKWVDDEKNWKRAFSDEVPSGVIVVHSYYWRSPHFTVEEVWAFQIKAVEGYKKAMFEHYKLRKAIPSENLPVAPSLNGETLAWFLPKAFNQYDMWILSEEPNSNFRLFEDKETGDIFFTDNGG